MQGHWCLNPNESLSPGQREEIDRVYRAQPAFPAQNPLAIARKTLDNTNIIQIYPNTNRGSER